MYTIIVRFVSRTNALIKQSLTLGEFSFCTGAIPITTKRPSIICKPQWRIDTMVFRFHGPWPTICFIVCWLPVITDAKTYLYRSTYVFIALRCFYSYLAMMETFLLFWSKYYLHLTLYHLHQHSARTSISAPNSLAHSIPISFVSHHLRVHQCYANY